MRIAVLSDIHANREALAACLAHLAREPADQIVFSGDIVGYGADPLWCLETVMEHCTRGAVALLGNHDAAVTGDADDMNDLAQSAINWTRRQLGREHRAFIDALPLTFEKGEVLFVHASAAAPRAWHYITNALEADASLRHTRQRVTICGHVHQPRYFHGLDGRPLESFVPSAGMPVPLLRARRWVAVLGAVGQPRDGNPAAAYAVLDSAKGHIIQHRVPYDVETAAQKIRDAGLPDQLASRLHSGS